MIELEPISALTIDEHHDHEHVEELTEVHPELEHHDEHSEAHDHDHEHDHDHDHEHQDVPAVPQEMLDELKGLESELTNLK